jgi:hypothetical protein
MLSTVCLDTKTKARGSSTMAEQLPHDPKVLGLSLVTETGTGIDKISIKILLWTSSFSSVGAQVRKGSLGTVDLLIKLSCFVKWSIMFPISKADDLS